MALWLMSQVLEASPCMQDCRRHRDDIPAAFAAAFEEAHKRVCVEIDAYKSGTTAVATLIAGDEVRNMPLLSS